MKKDAVLLDVTCSVRGMWYQKNWDRALYTDICPRQVGNLIVDPDQIEDYTKLSFDDETFFHVVFDPPFVKRKQFNKSWLSNKYGLLICSTWEENIIKGFNECWRVLKQNGTLVMKWSEVDITLKHLLSLLPVQPLYGTNSKSKTYFLVFIK